MSPVAIAAIVLAVCAFVFGWITHRGHRRIATLQRQLATALGIIGERDDVIKELEQANDNLDARNARLHHDVKAMRERLPRLADEFASEVEAMETERRRLIPLAGEYWGRGPLADPDPTRSYIPDYGVPATEDPTVLDYDPWKDETR